MNSLIEQSQAYWNLRMVAEAVALAKEALAQERDATGGDTTGPAAEWCARLAFSCGDFASVAARGLREPRFPGTSRVLYVIATALHYLGRYDEAVEILSPLLASHSDPVDRFQMACFLAQAGRVDEAVEHLFRSLPSYRKERDKTWIDGDLKRLWPILAEGRFLLATAHRLVESEFEILREWQPGRNETWALDTTLFNDLPTALRPLFGTVSRMGEYRLHPVATLAAPALAERFEQWVRNEIAASQRAFDVARGIALRRVLDAQPLYAQAAWGRRDLYALRQHVHWAVGQDPARIHGFAHIAGIGPLLDEVRRMLASDAEFFVKLERSCQVLADDSDAARGILDSLPDEWGSHPLVLMHHTYVLMAENRPLEALALQLRVCDQWPDDAAPFCNAARMAIQFGLGEIVPKIHARAPGAARFYRDWARIEVWLNSNGEVCLFGDYEVKKSLFRGQPDIVGHLSGTVSDEHKGPPCTVASE